MLVRKRAHRINARREKGLLLKLDIAKAFDTISWSFLTEVLRRLGFGDSWLNIIAIMLRTASTRVLFNGVPRDKITYVRGLCQGNPISPILFVMGMEVFTILMKKVTDQNLVSGFRGCSALQRTSIYADDVVIFLKPKIQDLVITRGCWKYLEKPRDCI
jgi:hypothetical protein